MWTQFWDMHSGGGLKEKWDKIYIEAPENEAKVIFYNRFGHNPERVTCTCCGEDYSISSNEDLAQLTAYQRNCRFSKKENKYIEKKGDYREYMTLDEYLKEESVLFIRAEEVKPEERQGDVPNQGYMWVD